MIVDRIEIPVCKPCPRCGMPTVYHYKWTGKNEKYLVTCENRCVYTTNHNGCSAEQAIVAWNTLVAGVEKPPVENAIPHQIVQYERKTMPVRKFGKATVVPWYTFANWDVHTMQQIIHEEKRRIYHKIADELFEEGIGETTVYTSDFEKDLIIRANLQVVDDR